MITRRNYLKRSPLRRVSKKRAKEAKTYTKLKAAYLTAHPVCEKCDRARSTDLHHRRGRLNGGYLDVTSFAALCRFCHDGIHLNPKAARAEGWLK